MSLFWTDEWEREHRTVGFAVFHQANSKLIDTFFFSKKQAFLIYMYQKLLDTFGHIRNESGSLSEVFTSDLCPTHLRVGVAYTRSVLLSQQWIWSTKLACTFVNNICLSCNQVHLILWLASLNLKQKRSKINLCFLWQIHAVCSFPLSTYVAQINYRSLIGVLSPRDT